MRIGLTRIVLLSTLFAIACGDDGGTGGATGSSSSSTSAAPASASSATSGTSTTSASTTATVTSQSASTGSEDPEPCVLADAEDHTGVATFTIRTMGVTYVPKCVRVSAGTAITFESSFSAHPLVGGPIENGVGVADPTSPITRTDSGASATFTLTDPGERPYFCENHSTIGMFGTVYVE